MTDNRNDDAPEAVDGSVLGLILYEQRRISRSVSRLYSKVDKINVSNARIPECVRDVVREEMKVCPAYQYYKDRRKELDALSGTVAAQGATLAAQSKAIESLKKKGTGGRRGVFIVAPDKKTIISTAVAALLAAGGALWAWAKGWFLNGQ